jgi:hypothetical protein
VYNLTGRDWETRYVFPIGLDFERDLEWERRRDDKADDGEKSRKSWFAALT